MQRGRCASGLDAHQKQNLRLFVVEAQHVEDAIEPAQATGLSSSGAECGCHLCGVQAWPRCSERLANRAQVLQGLLQGLAWRAWRWPSCNREICGTPGASSKRCHALGVLTAALAAGQLSKSCETSQIAATALFEAALARCA